MNQKKEWIKKVERIIALGEVEKSIELIREAVEEDKHYRTVILNLSSSYYRFRRNQQIGVLPMHDRSMQMITNGLIELLSDLEADDGFTNFPEISIQEIQRAEDSNSPDNQNEEALTLPSPLFNQHPREVHQGNKPLKANDRVIDVLLEDLAAPAFQQIGKALGTSLGLINTLLLPVEYVNQMAYTTFRKNINTFAEKIEDTDVDRLVSVPTEISVPVLEKLFHVTNEELVNMFTNLLKRSSSVDECHLAHPNFANIIASISPDEARILNKQKGAPIPVIYPSVVYTTEEDDNRLYRDSQRGKVFYSNLEHEIDLIFPENLQLYTENLFCLGILDSFGIRLPRSFHLEDFEKLKQVYREPIARFYREHSHLLNDDKLNAKKEIEFGQFSFTNFGKLFVKACCD